ncbi:hypothetical protein MJO29_003056 [Puccinia striiformis f. sp. tritici]|nr:hypothetical protein MJO29_011990 [Puccinia striiformis f. sp. tritici]KAI7949055.1 hypothetical protein MJO29_010720 [Puccinia striiformis f. sp. tritici]KAI7958137.1 hypothetical protein MJO29_006354 [Puccinia striiformis f. sp. tritici]KAI7964958.1 hypothetical protein MJO29_003056 [Puccinia striiformis f. sp. tritici]POW00162.1 hypothetical protein PSHT_13220 [Puccinia striiformis]
MAHQFKILDDSTLQKKRTEDVYKNGANALQEDYRNNSRKLNRMRPSTVLHYHTPIGPLEDEEPIDEDEIEEELVE